MNKPTLSGLTLFILLLSMGLSASSLDIIIPCYPMWVREFGVTVETVKSTMPMNAIVIAVLGFFYGPISDIYGRRPLMLIGLSVYVFSSIICAMADCFNTILIWRAIQGAGAGVTYVLVISIVTDVFKGAKRAKVLGFLSFLFPISLGIAPIVGAWLLKTTGSWESIFIYLAVVMGSIVVYLYFNLPETLQTPKEEINWKAYQSGIKKVMKSPIFHYNNIFSSFYISSYLVFLNASSFIYQTYFGMDARIAALFISAPLGFQILAAFYYQRSVKTQGVEESFKWGYYAMIVSALFCIFMVSPTVDYTPYRIAFCMVLYNLGIPFIMGICTSQAMEASDRHSGLISSLLSTSRSVAIAGFTFAAAQHNDATPDTSLSYIFGISLSLVVVKLAYDFFTKRHMTTQ